MASVSNAQSLSSVEAASALARFLSTRAAASRHLHAAHSAGKVAGAPLADDAYTALETALAELQHQAAAAGRSAVSAARAPPADAVRAARPELG